MVWRRLVQYADKCSTRQQNTFDAIRMHDSLFSLFLLLSCARAVITVSLGKVQRVVEHKMLVLLVWNRKIETPVWSRLLKLFKFPVSNRAMEYLREIFLVTFPPSRIMVASLGSSSKYHKPLRWNEMIDISLSSLFISHLCTFLTCLIFSPHSLLLSSHQSSTNIFFPEYTYRIRASSHFISDSWFNMRDIDQY